MKVQKVTRITCEGCGEYRHFFEDEKVPEEFPTHTSALSGVKMTEPECIALYKARMLEAEERFARQQAEQNRLAAACAGHPAFRSLCGVFPEETGYGLQWEVFGNLMKSIGDSAEPSINIDRITGGSSQGYHELLGKCIAAARESIRNRK